MYSNVIAFSILSQWWGHGRNKIMRNSRKIRVFSQEKIGKGICLSFSTKKEYDTGDTVQGTRCGLNCRSSEKGGYSH